MKISGVIFDLGEVLLRGLYGIEEVINWSMGIKLETNIFYGNRENTLLFKGRISEEDYWRALIHKHELPLTVEQLKVCVRFNFGYIGGTRQIVEELRARGFILGLLSVHAKEWIGYCEDQFHYHNLFDATCYSFEQGLCKPHPKAYLEILKRLNLWPDECVFIDDRKENIKAARNMGMTGIRFTNAENLRTSLEGMGLIR